MTQSKIDRLLDLARTRQSDTSWPDYNQVCDFHDGVYECEHVSPYTKSAGDVDADVFLMLQDWSSSDRLGGDLDLNAIKYGHTPGLETNKNLFRLLREHLSVELHETYGTNLFPFIKKGAMNATIRSGDRTRAAKEYALPQVRIVAPRIVVCLGVVTFRSMLRACGQPRVAGNTADAIDSPFVFEDSMVWCQSHPGRLGKNNRNRGGVDRVTGDWAEMAEWLHAARSRGVLRSK